MNENEKKILKDEQPEKSARQVSDEDMSGVVGGRGSGVKERTTVILETEKFAPGNLYFDN